MSFAELASELADTARDCYARGWALGTSGNFSAVVGLAPFRLAITSSGVDKGTISADGIVQIDDRVKVVSGSGRPSAEASIHVAIARARGAGAILHTHSIWSTILSETAPSTGLVIEGFEMLKGLDGVHTHEHRECLPVLENTQDWEGAVPRIEAVLRANPDAHGFLIRRHGLYTWGRLLADAKRQLEVLEFLFEVTGRKRGMTWQP